MLGSIISAVGNVAGGLFNAKQQEKFAKNALTWKAQDAERAGISKYFAMGAPTSNFAPVSVGDFGSLGSAVDKHMGQTGPAGTTTGKLTGTTAAIQAAQLDGLRIDNDIKRAELASRLNIASQPGAGGVLDRDVTTGPGGAQMKKEISPSSPGSPQRSFGVSPEVDMYRTHSGFAPVPPQQLAEVHENNAIMRWQWMLRNQLLPFFSDQYATAPGDAPPGHTWRFDPLNGEYRLYKRSPGEQRLWEYGKSMYRR